MDDQLGALEGRTDPLAVGDIGDPRLRPGVADSGGRVRGDVDPDHLGALGRQQRQRAAPMKPAAPVTATRLPASSTPPRAATTASSAPARPGELIVVDRLPASIGELTILARPVLRSPTARRGARARTDWRLLVRGAATLALGAAFAAPFVRKRWRVPASVTTAAVASGRRPSRCCARGRGRATPPSTRSRCGRSSRPRASYDDPEALRRRLQVTYPAKADRRIGAGRLPNARLQKALGGSGAAMPSTARSRGVHWLWFLEPHGLPVWILARHPERFARSARQMAAIYDIGRAVSLAVPTAPPWWASENGYTDEEVRRIMVEVGEKEWGRAWGLLYGSLGGNPWAAMPSLHFATAVMAALLLAEAGPVEGAAGFAYAAALGFALVYLGEHYVFDLLAGAGVVLAVRKGEPLVDPLAQRVSRGCSGWSASQTRNRVCDDGAVTEEPDQLSTDPELTAGEMVEEEPSFFADPRRLLQTLVAVVLLVAIYVLFPKVVGLRGRARQGGRR